MQNSTRGQHYLPQFLLKGFTSRERKGKHHTFLFMRGRAPIETNLINVAKGRDFYGNPSASSIEGNLARLESVLSQTVVDLRCGKAVEQERICELVVNTHLRSANVRKVTESAASAFFEGFARLLTHPEWLQKFKNETLNRLMRCTQEEEVLKRLQAIPEGVRSEALQQMFRNVEGDILPVLNGMQEGLRELSLRYDGELEMKKIHNGVLSEGLTPEARMQVMRRLTWSVESVPAKTLILGDVAVVARSADVAPLSSLLAAEGEITEAYMPLSASKLLVRTLGCHAQGDAESINLAQAELSSESFVSSVRTPHPVGLEHALGTRSTAFVYEAINKALANLIDQPFEPA